VTYRMAPIAISFSDLEGHFCCLTISNSSASGNVARISYDRKAHATCNFKCFVENEGLYKVAGSHVHGESCNISETVQDREVVTTDH